MIPTLKRIWKDIRKGENIDLHITVAVAITLTVLNLVGLAPQALVGPITLTVLSLLAITSLGNRYRLEHTLEKLKLMPLGPSPSLRTYSHWNVKEVYDVIRSAKESVVIVQTWVGEAATLSSHIREASHQTSKGLKVDIYMLDPDRPFGGQRIAEANGYQDGTEMVWREKFREKFKDVPETLKRHLSGAQNVNLTIYKYATMPALRMYIMDDREFIFSWFPVNGPASQSVCFHLAANSAIGEDLLAVERLRSQLKGIHKVSQVIE